MDFFTKWSEICTIPSQKASVVVDVLVTNFFYNSVVLRKLHSNQGQNLESQLLQEALPQSVQDTPFL
jgi:hypothetical protein